MLRENGILCLTIHDNLSIDESQARHMVQSAKLMDPSGQIRLLIINGENNDLSFGAQRLFASANGFSRVAFLTQSRLQAEVGRVLATMMQALKCPFEFKLFYDRKQAEAWLLRP